LGADAGQGSKQGPKEESKAAVTPIRAVRSRALTRKTGLPSRARARENSPDLGFDQNDASGLMTPKRERQCCACRWGNRFADVIGELALELCHPVVVVVETTIFRFGTRGSSARMSWVQTFTSPTLTACVQGHAGW